MLSMIFNSKCDTAQKAALRKRLTLCMYRYSVTFYFLIFFPQVILRSVVMRTLVKNVFVLYLIGLFIGCLQVFNRTAEITELQNVQEEKYSARSITRTFNGIYQEYNNPEGRVLVTAHRGDWRSHPENSLSAIQGAIDMGVDIVEIDVRKTLDGYLILMHDSTVNRTTNGYGSVSSMTLQQIKALFLKSNQGGSGAAVTSERISTLSEAMIVAKGKIMVNLDKGWEIRNDIYAVLDALDLVDHGIFKSSASNSEVEPWLGSKNQRPNYMAIFSNDNTSDIDTILSGAAPEAIELIFDGENRTVISSMFLDKIKNNNKRIWINTLWSSLSAGHTDDVSVSNTTHGWGWMIDKGASIIQTDRPAQLIDYLNPPSPSEISTKIYQVMQP